MKHAPLAIGASGFGPAAFDDGRHSRSDHSRNGRRAGYRQAQTFWRVNHYAV
ncbi:MAG: hypothetical protein OZ920_00510 [Burkholderiales bacterium]|nr:hypothetical protein [Burkholderiaceae bacterium]MCL4701779.1 hypothetical protein [Burkholderiaceae bacterium]MEB2335141.1 hypothetical protein [Burkholderiales bacterium]